MPFRPIKTHDIVWYQGQMHLVKSIIADDTGFKFDIVPVSSTVKTVTYEDIYQNSLPAKYLVASKNAQKFFRSAYKLASNKPVENSVDLPMDNQQILQAIKSDLTEFIKQNPSRLIPQRVLDDIVQRQCVRQGYLLAQYHRKKVKSSLKYSTWQDIANLAVKISNAHNRKMRNSTEVLFKENLKDSEPSS